ncbi:MBL fold metallo-hydrolase [Fictibacillus gelatini]|uniref:MBL fold metallo-hydrolase n=1 Tax=Fictibacillus gelatini TaxID=225985 RepID=UPI0004062194|nr:MBL fold metallo-hydrolase [Fictibacillus gelatini]
MNTLSDKITKIELPTPFKVGKVNAYIVKGEKLTLIDCGPKTEEAHRVLVDHLHAHGISIHDIEQIVLTHYHPDHVGGLGYFDIASLQVISSEKSIPYLEQNEEFYSERKMFYESIYKKMGVSPHLIPAELEKTNEYLSYSAKIKPDIVLKDGDEVPGLSGWTVIETPGHSPDHISLFHKESGVMVGGDFLIAHISSNALIEPPLQANLPRPKPLLEYRTSFKKVAELGVSIVYSGHGKEITAVGQLIEERLEAQDERANRLYELIVGEHTAFELCQKLFSHIYLRELDLTMSETIGHLDLLEEWGAIAKKDKNGITHYTRTKHGVNT